MNHISCWQIPGSSYHRFSSRQTFRVGGLADLLTFLQDPWATNSVDGAIDTTTAQERPVGGVYNGVYILVGDIAYQNAYASRQKHLLLVCR
jgi:hypothetical protein